LAHRLLPTALALLVLSPLAAASVPLGPPAPRDQREITLAGLHATVTADEIIARYGSRRVVELTGAALITATDIEISAQHLLLDVTDTEHPRVTGSGNVRIARAGSEASGSELEFDFRTRTGWVNDPLISQPLPIAPKRRDLLYPHERPREIRVSARRASLSQPITQPSSPTALPPNRYVDLVEPAVWIPQGKTPQFRLLAASAQMMLCDPGCLVQNVDVFKMRDARLQLGGHTVLRLPELHLGTGGLYLPMFGYNSTWGVFAQQPMSIRMAENLRLRLTPRLGTTQGLTGTSSLEWTTPVGQLALAATFRERTMLPVSREVVQYSRWPDASWTLPKFDLPGVGGNVSASAAVGLIREHGTGTLWRSRYDVGWNKTVVDGATFGASMRAKAHWSWGDAGYSYGWMGGGATIDKNFAERLWVKLGADAHWVYGTTPFRFERLEAPTLLSGEARWRVSNRWVLQDSLAYDIERGRFTDHSTSILYRDRLLEYGVTVRSEPELEFQLAAGVVGF